MSHDLETAVAAHYDVADLLNRILAGVAAAGGDPANPTPETLAPVDEFHIGGRPATAFAVERMNLTAEDHVLDVGCGIGGATRYLAAEIGCRATGIDLTPGYIDVARILAERTGLADKIAYAAGSALDLPFEDAHFDAALTLHVAMNIRDRAGLYGEIARVLKPGATFCVYDVMKGPAEGLQFPVPWAETEATSHLTTPDEMQALLTAAGFAVEETVDRTAFAIEFFELRLAAAADGPPPLGLHLLMGETGPAKFANMLTNLKDDRITPTLMIARR